MIDIKALFLRILNNGLNFISSLTKVTITARVTLTACHEKDKTFYGTSKTTKILRKIRWIIGIIYLEIDNIDLKYYFLNFQEKCVMSALFHFL